MSQYIECPTPKARYIIENYSGWGVPEDTVRSFMLKGRGVICVLLYKSHDAAAFIPDESELEVFMEVNCPKIWIVGDRQLFLSLV